MKRVRGPRIARALAACSAAVLVGLLAISPVRADTKGELAAARAKLAVLLNRISAETAHVNKLEAQANAIADQINVVESRLANTQKKINHLEQEIRRAEEELLATQAQLDERARIAYENGPALSLAFLLGANSLSDLSDRLEIVNHAAKSDRELIEQIEALQARLRSKQADLEKLQRTLLSDRAALQAKHQALQDKLSEAQSVLRQLESDRAAAQRLVRKLEAKRRAEIAEARRLAALQALLAGRHSGGAISGVLLVCPVDPPRSYSDDFGAPRYGGGFHYHQGNDIFAPLDTPVRAPFPGNAARTDNTLGGIAVTVHGSQGYVYNAHLDKVGQLGSVSTGDIIGYVGNTGDADGGPYHDHFEWHPGNGGAVDPYPYLNSVC